MNEIVQLRGKLSTHFSFEELKNFAWDQGIDTETLRQGTKTEFVNDLIYWFGERRRLGELVAFARERRPLVEWPDVLAGSLYRGSLRCRHHLWHRNCQAIL